MSPVDDAALAVLSERSRILMIHSDAATTIPKEDAKLTNFKNRHRFSSLTPTNRAGMGRQQRTKQAEPAPLAGSTAHPYSGAHVGKKKAALEARSARDGTAKPSPRAVKAKAAKRDSKGRETGGFLSGRNAGGAIQKAKKSQKKVGQGAERDEDDIDGLEEQDDYDQEDDLFADGEDKGLEAARSLASFFASAPSLPVDPAPPQRSLRCR